jgi:tRNA1(Val) A37 N6-methylase TrmN6
MAQCYCIVIEHVFVLVEAIGDVDSGLRFLPTSIIATRSKEYADEKICDITDERHKAFV